MSFVFNLVRKSVLTPPRADCPNCLRETKWVEISGKGTIHTVTTLYFSGERFLKDLPFQLVYVDLIGLDTVVNIMDVMFDAFKDPKFRVAPILRKMVSIQPAFPYLFLLFPRQYRIP